MNREHRTPPGRKLIILIPALLACGICIFLFARKSAADRIVSQVRDSCPAHYPSVTYGEAYEAWYRSPQWKYRSENGAGFAVFSGQCEQDGEPVSVELRYRVKNGLFWLAGGTLNGVETDPALLGRYDHKPFADYGKQRVSRKRGMPGQRARQPLNENSLRPFSA